MRANHRIKWQDADKGKADLLLALDSLEQAKALKSPRTIEW